MSILLNVVLAIIGTMVFLFPSFLWNKRYGKLAMDIKIVQQRKRYKKISIVGFILMVAAVINFLAKDETFSSLVLYFIIGDVFAQNRFFLEPYYDSSIVEELEHRRFCLFLRPFNSDGVINLKSRWGYMPVSIEDTFCEELCKSVSQTYSVGNPNWCLPSNKNSISIYATDTEWHQVVGTLSDNACVILLKVGDTPGCTWEIENLKKNNLLDKVIAIVENEEAFDVAKKYMNVSLNLTDISFPLVIWYNVNETAWQCKHIQTKKDIKLSLSAFVQSQEEVKKQVAENKAQSKLSYWVSKKKIPARWYVILEALINPFALVMINRWSKGFAYSFCGIFALFCILWIEVLPVAYSYDLFIVTVLCFMALIPFVFFAPRVSRYSYSWGSDAVFKTINKELCVWLLILAVFLYILA